MLSKQIGFINQPQQWEGPLTLNFKFYRKHTKTIRYRSELERGNFDFYIPIFLVQKSFNNEITDSLSVTLSKSSIPANITGFKGQKFPSNIGEHYIEYSFYEEMGRSVQYRHLSEMGEYRIYFPKEILGDMDRPQKIYSCINATESHV
ncbi:MAG: hypothetical protein IPP06_05295 [Saprospiraceae bacterium]|nr:hypothetical protein [Candidatus Vicinibacter affinis]